MATTRTRRTDCTESGQEAPTVVAGMIALGLPEDLVRAAAYTTLALLLAVISDGTLPGDNATSVNSPATPFRDPTKGISSAGGGNGGGGFEVGERVAYAIFLRLRHPARNGRITFPFATVSVGVNVNVFAAPTLGATAMSYIDVGHVADSHGDKLEYTARTCRREVSSWSP